MGEQWSLEQRFPKLFGSGQAGPLPHAMGTAKSCPSLCQLWTGCRIYATIETYGKQSANPGNVCPQGRKVPYRDWFLALKDKRAAAKILKRLDLLALGGFGQHRMLGGGLAELKIEEGPGYRVYIGLAGSVLVILLCGGDKSSQRRDIEKAESYWNDYRGKEAGGMK